MRQGDKDIMKPAIFVPFHWILLCVVGLGLSSCEETHQTAIEEAATALEAARAANGKGYAPEAFQKAEEAYADAMEEVESQNKRSYFIRTYGTSTELLRRATEASNEAKKKAEDGRQEMRAEADTLIKDVQKRFESAEIVVEQSKRIRLKDVLEKAGAVLFEAENAFKAGDFLAAYEKAQDAQALIEELITDPHARARDLT